MSRSLFAVGIDPGATIGVAAVGMTSTIRILETASLGSVRELHRWLSNYGTPDILAVEWWVYQGPKRAKGVPEAAEACGRVAGLLEYVSRDYTCYTRAEVLQSLALKSNANKGTLIKRLVALADIDPRRLPANDHEADAAAVAITGLNRMAWERM